MGTLESVIFFLAVVSGSGSGLCASSVGQRCHRLSQRQPLSLGRKKAPPPKKRRDGGLKLGEQSRMRLLDTLEQSLGFNYRPSICKMQETAAGCVVVQECVVVVSQKVRMEDGQKERRTSFLRRKNYDAAAAKQGTGSQGSASPLLLDEPHRLQQDQEDAGPAETRNADSRAATAGT
jgi:hypothetical protein